MRLRLLVGAVLLLGGCLPLSADDRPKLSLVGSPEPVDRAPRSCGAEDIPDSAARLLRRADGSLRLYASHYVTRPLEGPDFLHLRKDCDVAFAGRDSSEASDFDAKAWITSTWTRNGTDVVAIVHNEYQAHRFPGKCQFRTYLDCWYNFLTLAVSHDGGDTFQRLSRRGPVAAIGEIAQSDEGRPRGFFAASNMIEREGYVYFISMTTGTKSQPRGSCLFRAKDPFDETSWEVLTADGYAPSLSNIYQDLPPPICRRLENLHGDVMSVLRHEGSGYYLALQLMPGGPDKGHLAVSYSKNLTDWSAPEAFAQVPSVFSPGCQTERYTYPVILDPDAPGRNFDTIGGGGYLILVHNRVGSCRTLYDRQLVKWRLAVR